MKENQINVNVSGSFKVRGHETEDAHYVTFVKNNRPLHALAITATARTPRQAAIKSAATASRVSGLSGVEFFYNGEKIYEVPAEPKKSHVLDDVVDLKITAGVDPGYSWGSAVIFFGTDPTSQAIADAANAKTPTKTARIVYKYDNLGRTLLKFYDKGTGAEITEKVPKGPLTTDGWMIFSGKKENCREIMRFYSAGGSSFSIDKIGYDPELVEQYVEPSLQQLQGELAAVKSQLNSALSRVENEKAKREAQRLQFNNSMECEERQARSLKEEINRQNLDLRTMAEERDNYKKLLEQAFEENRYWAGLSKCVSEFLLWTEQKSIADVGDQLFPAVRSAYEKLEKNLAAERKRSDVLETQVRDLRAAAPVQQSPLQVKTCTLNSKTNRVIVQLRRADNNEWIYSTNHLPSLQDATLEAYNVAKERGFMIIGETNDRSTYGDANMIEEHRETKRQLENTQTELLRLKRTLKAALGAV